jgi:hypothetical protein
MTVLNIATNNAPLDLPGGYAVEVRDFGINGHADAVHVEFTGVGGHRYEAVATAAEPDPSPDFGIGEATRWGPNTRFEFYDNTAGGHTLLGSYAVDEHGVARAQGLPVDGQTRASPELPHRTHREPGACALEESTFVFPDGAEAQLAMTHCGPTNRDQPSVENAQLRLSSPSGLRPTLQFNSDEHTPEGARPARLTTFDATGKVADLVVFKPFTDITNDDLQAADEFRDAQEPPMAQRVFDALVALAKDLWNR